MKRRKRKSYLDKNVVLLVRSFLDIVDEMFENGSERESCYLLSEHFSQDPLETTLGCSVVEAGATTILRWISVFKTPQQFDFRGRLLRIPLEVIQAEKDGFSQTRTQLHQKFCRCLREKSQNLL